MAKPATLLRAAASGAVYRQRFLHHQVGLDFLDCGEFLLPPGAATSSTVFPGRESLLFMWKGSASVELCGSSFQLEPYDTFYIPRDAAFRIGALGSDGATLVHASAPAANVHPVFHSRFAEFSQREDRIRHLKGKDVFMMFDVGEAADKLVAGYTFFQPFQRSWPPHNHTDQEEVYYFIKGRGSMEVYEEPETLSFVHSVQEGDAVTIPILNYHPVFSQEDPLEFIWCIAGERYWVGDKNKAFLEGKVSSLTT
jgi:mannose-6-phosphate isomerase-like protein (cupin superfamily)